MAEARRKSDPENEVMQPFLEPAEEMRGETHYEGGTHIASWALGREIPRRRRGWAPRRRSPCASLFAAVVVVPDHRDSSERSFKAMADLLVQSLAPSSSVGARKGGINFQPWLRTPC